MEDSRPHSIQSLLPHSGRSPPAGGGPVDLREGGLLVPAGGRGEGLRALQGRPRLVPALRHPRDHARTGKQGYQMAKFNPLPSLDCARVEGLGHRVEGVRAQSKEGKGSNFAA